MEILRAPALRAAMLVLVLGGLPPTARSANLDPLEEWMGVYLQGQKVGSTHLVLEPIAETDPLYAEELRYRFVEKLSIQGIDTETEGLLRDGFSLGRFRFQFQGVGLAGGNLSCSGRVENPTSERATLHVAVESEGTVTRREFPLEEPCYLSSASHLPALLRELKPGAEFSWLVFDPMSQSLSAMSFRVEERSQREAMGQTYKAAKVVMTFQGIEQTSWMTPSGLRLRDEALDGMMVAEIESEPQATPSVSLLDPTQGISEFMIGLIDDFKVQLEGRIPQPRKCRRLVLEVSGIGPEDLVLDEYWQRFAGKKQGEKTSEEKFQLEIGLQSRKLPPEDVKPYLEAGFLVQADAPAIVEQATRITQGLATHQEKAERLCQWVFDHVDRSALRLTIPSAVEVLNSRQGDCNEHATLFAALARAAGVPTKICVGAMYAQGAFFYHAWNEVYLEDSGWTPVDATLNQIPADATHLKLAEGELDQQVGVLKAVGKLQLKVIESGGRER